MSKTKNKPAGNVAALREALDMAEGVILCASRFSEKGAFEDDHTAIENVRMCNWDGALKAIRAARSKPPRNCDRFKHESDAHIAFINEVWLKKLAIFHGLNTCDDWVELLQAYDTSELMKSNYAQWLFGTAKKEGDAE